MRNESQSLYQVLRIGKTARPAEIDRAYRRIKAELQKETTPPDPRLRVMIEHAHDVLMDPVRREAYDKQWFAPKAQLDRARRRPAMVAAAAATVAALGAATWYVTREPAATREALPLKQIENAASMAVGRVHRIEPDGTRSQLGVAFAISEGVLVTACDGLSPRSEIQVQFGARVAQVHVSGVDASTHLCQLTGGTVGSWPLLLARSAPSSDEAVYVAFVGPKAQPQLSEARIRRAARAGDAPAFEVTVPTPPQDLGAPLLDVEAHVVGAATRIDGKTLYAAVPRSWLPEVIVEHSPPQPRAAEPAKDTEGTAPPGPNISPERRERLQKAFRPPPQVPDDI